LCSEKAPVYQKRFSSHESRTRNQENEPNKQQFNKKLDKVQNGQSASQLLKSNPPEDEEDGDDYSNSFISSLDDNKS
jgi:hypothetical protein